MSDDLADLRRKFEQVRDLLDGTSLRAITTRVAAKSKTAAIPAIQPNSLSHWGRGARKGSYKVQARYEIKGDDRFELKPTVLPLAGLLEHGSGSTWKAPRRRGAARRKRGTVGTYTRAKVPPRHSWSKAQPAVEKAAPGFVHDEVSKVLGRVF